MYARWTQWIVKKRQTAQSLKRGRIFRACSKNQPISIFMIFGLVWIFKPLQLSSFLRASWTPPLWSAFKKRNTAAIGTRDGSSLNNKCHLAPSNPNFTSLRTMLREERQDQLGGVFRKINFIFYRFSIAEPRSIMISIMHSLHYAYTFVLE